MLLLRNDLTVELNGDEATALIRVVRSMQGGYFDARSGRDGHIPPSRFAGCDVLGLVFCLPFVGSGRRLDRVDVNRSSGGVQNSGAPHVLCRGRVELSADRRADMWPCCSRPSKLACPRTDDFSAEHRLRSCVPIIRLNRLLLGGRGRIGEHSARTPTGMKLSALPRTISCVKRIVLYRGLLGEVFSL